MQVNQAIEALIEHAKNKGERYGEGQCAFALGYVGSAIESALRHLSDKQRAKFTEEIMAHIAWAKRNGTVA